MAILLCHFFYLENEAVKHAKDTPPTKLGKQCCVLCIHYFWSCYL